MAALDKGFSAEIFQIKPHCARCCGDPGMVWFAAKSLDHHIAWRPEATHLSSWAGLGKRSPLVAGVFTLFLLAFAGIPLTSGFTAVPFIGRASIRPVG